MSLTPVELLAPALQAAGLPGNVSGPYTSPSSNLDATQSWHFRASQWFRMDWPTVPTAQQISQADGVIQATSLIARTARKWRAILNDLQALTNTQRTAIKTDLTNGTPAKWTTLTDDPVVWAVLGNAAAATTQQLVAAVVQIILTNPTYLVQPTFDATINIPGDQVA